VADANTLGQFSLADPQANAVLQKVRDELGVTTPWRYLAAPVGITFPAKNVSVEVQHQLGEVPDGFVVLNADCLIKRTPGKAWTKTLAYVMSDTDVSTADLAFGVYRQGVRSANASS
jgi:hypothetical protein